jgi:hypothetical protein
VNPRWLLSQFKMVIMFSKNQRGIFRIRWELLQNCQFFFLKCFWNNFNTFIFSCGELSESKMAAKSILDGYGNFFPNFLLWLLFLWYHKVHYGIQEFQCCHCFVNENIVYICYTFVFYVFFFFFHRKKITFF